MYKRTLLPITLLILISILLVNCFNNIIYANATETDDQVPYTQAKLVEFLYGEASDIYGTMSAHIYVYKLLKSNGQEPPVPIYVMISRINVMPETLDIIMTIGFKSWIYMVIECMA